MGEKKRKRRESDAADQIADTTPKSERKKLKKSRESLGDSVSKPKIDEAPEVPALLSPIATPMAGRKLTKKIFKLISHAAKEKAIRRGIKEVVLALRKKENGVIVMAGDVFPVEVIAHIPLLCEESNIPYCFVSRKTELGAAGLTKRPTSVVLISDKKLGGDIKAELEAVRKEVASIQNLF